MCRSMIEESVRRDTRNAQIKTPSSRHHKEIKEEVSRAHEHTPKCLIRLTFAQLLVGMTLRKNIVNIVQAWKASKVIGGSNHEGL